MRSTKGRVAGVAAVCVLVGLSLWPAQSFAATARNVRTQQEAWHHASPADPGEDDPTCALPVGCVPQPGVPVNPYPEDTLHIGVAGGRDTARTFLTLDLSALPTGAFVTGGTLTVPVLTDDGSGSMQPEASDVAACPVVGAVKDAQGGAPDEQPEFSCETAAKARFRAGDEPVLLVDLAPIASLLSSGGVALVPSEDARAGGATWRVVVPARGHESKRAIVASLTYDPPASLDPIPEPAAPAGGGTDSQGLSSESGPLSAGGFDPAPAAAEPAPSFDNGPAPAAAGAVEGPLAAGPAAPVAAPVPLAAGGYAYPAVWLAPLVVAAIAGMLARSLGGEIVLAERPGATEATRPGLIERVLAAIRPPASPGSVTS